MNTKTYDILEKRVKAVINENGDSKLNKGIGYVLTKKLSISPNPSVALLYDFAEYYGVSIDYLLGRSEVYGVF